MLSPFLKYLTRDTITSNIMKIIRNEDNINHALKKYGILSNYRWNHTSWIILSIILYLPNTINGWSNIIQWIRTFNCNYYTSNSIIFYWRKINLSNNIFINLIKSIHELMLSEVNSILIRSNHVFSVIYLNFISILELFIIWWIKISLSWT
jgi:hypothetical protein